MPAQYYYSCFTDEETPLEKLLDLLKAMYLVSEKARLCLQIRHLGTGTYQVVRRAGAQGNQATSPPVSGQALSLTCQWCGYSLCFTCCTDKKKSPSDIIQRFTWSVGESNDLLGQWWNEEPCQVCGQVKGDGHSTLLDVLPSL